MKQAKNRHSKTVSKPQSRQFTKNFSDNPLVPIDDVLRIGTGHYYRKNNELIKTNEACVKVDYGKDSVYNIQKYFGFKNEPSHLNYSQEFGGFYNLYKKLSWKPKKGNWCSIDKMLKHIFKGEHYDMILTYFYVMYCKPKHSLPAIGLVGNQSTGKSKFLELVLAMFDPNSKSIDPEDLTANYNESYVDKLAIVIDEKISGKDKRTIMRKLKKLITGGTQNRKGKYVADVDIDFFGKIFMASNDTEDMLALESENTRFWIIEVQQLKSDDFDILEKAIKEIPAFFQHLIKKHNPLKRVSRVWFNTDSFNTDAAKKMQENARPELIKAIIENLINYFLENESETEIYFTAEQFIEAYGQKEKWNSSWFSREIKKFFNRKSYAKRKGNPFFSSIVRTHGNNNIGSTNEIKQRRYYHFTKKEIFGLSDANELKGNEQQLIGEEDDLPF